MPLVSVVMSVYNDGRYVSDAIESILSQSFTDFEFLIVDDGSTDDTRAIIASYNDARIRLVTNARNLGLAPSLNKAIRLSRGEYIARQDADDISLKNRLSLQVNYLESHPHIAMLGSAAVLISQSGEWKQAWPVMLQDIDLKWALLFRNPFVHSSIMMRRSVVEQAGYYTEEPLVAKPCVEDYDLWCRINMIWQSANLPTPLLKYRANPTSVSVRTADEHLRQANRVASKNRSWVLAESELGAKRDAHASGGCHAYDDANELFRSPSGHDPELSPARLRAAVAFLDKLQNAFYAKYRFSRSDIGTHRRHWYWIWGKHLLALSLRTRAGLANKLTYAALGARYMMRQAVSLICGVPRLQRKRVLVCSKFVTVGGVETHIVNLCRLLAQNGAEVTVVSRVARSEVPALDQLRRVPVRFIATPFQHGGRVSTLWAMVFWPLRLRRHFDILYTFDLTWFTGFLARFVRPGGRVLGANWGPARPDEMRPAALKVLDGMLLESEFQAAPYRHLLPAGAIPHLAQITSAARREPRYVDVLRVAFLGRMDRNKGMHRLLDLWPTLAIQPARLDFYGDGWEFNRLASEIRTRALANVHLHGAYTPSALPEIYERTDLMVLPSESEGLPLVLMEAMAYGVPFVATDVGAIRTLAQDNPDVCVVPLDDAALKLGIERMARAIRNGQIDGQRLQQYHRERYSYDLVAGRWLQTILNPEELWQGGGPTTRRPRQFEPEHAEGLVGDVVRPQVRDRPVI